MVSFHYDMHTDTLFSRSRHKILVVAHADDFMTQNGLKTTDFFFL